MMTMFSDSDIAAAICTNCSSNAYLCLKIFSEFDFYMLPLLLMLFRHKHQLLIMVRRLLIRPSWGLMLLTKVSIIFLKHFGEVSNC